MAPRLDRRTVASFPPREVLLQADNHLSTVSNRTHCRPGFANFVPRCDAVATNGRSFSGMMIGK
jgi:hypothetical protein